MQIDRLESKLRYNQNLKIKIEGALSQLSDQEMNLVRLRYFTKEHMTWLQVSYELGFEKNYCTQVRNKIINKLSDFIYP